MGQARPGWGGLSERLPKAFFADAIPSDIDLKVPRSREGLYPSQILGRHKRYEAGVEDLVHDSFLAGLSTGRVNEVLESLMDSLVNASAVSEITKAL